MATWGIILVFRSAPTAQDNLDDLGVTGTWTPLYPKGHVTI